IDGLLMFSRLSRKSFGNSEIDMKEMVEQVVKEFKRSESDRNVTVKIYDLPYCCGEISLLRQVLANLVGNAFKFTRDQKDPVIEIGGYLDRNETVYYVKDNGAGFNMEYAHKLFGVFQRLHGVDEFEGSGVGLAIAKRIINRHGGRIW